MGCGQSTLDTATPGGAPAKTDASPATGSASKGAPETPARPAPTVGPGSLSDTPPDANQPQPPRTFQRSAAAPAASKAAVEAAPALEPEAAAPAAAEGATDEVSAVAPHVVALDESAVELNLDLLQAHDDPSKVVCGYLAKRGDGFSAFKDRYIVLDGGVLSYYDKESDYNRKARPKKNRAIPLKYYAVARGPMEGKPDDKSLNFQLVPIIEPAEATRVGLPGTKKGKLRVFVFRASKEQDRDDWMRCFFREKCHTERDLREFLDEASFAGLRVPDGLDAIEQDVRAAAAASSTSSPAAASAEGEAAAAEGEAAAAEGESEAAAAEGEAAAAEGEAATATEGEATATEGEAAAAEGEAAATEAEATAAEGEAAATEGEAEATEGEAAAAEGEAAAAEGGATAAEGEAAAAEGEAAAAEGEAAAAEGEAAAAEGEAAAAEGEEASSESEAAASSEVDGAASSEGEAASTDAAASSSSSAESGSAAKEGEIMKKGEKNKRWEKRGIRLEGSKLTYLKNGKVAKSKRNPIDVASCLLVPVPLLTKNASCRDRVSQKKDLTMEQVRDKSVSLTDEQAGTFIVLKPKSGSAFFFDAGSVDEREDWAAAILAAGASEATSF